MCFGGGSSAPVQAQVNPAPTPLDQAYKSVVQTTTTDNTPAPVTPVAATPADSLRTKNTGLTFSS